MSDTKHYTNWIEKKIVQISIFMNKFEIHISLAVTARAMVYTRYYRDYFLSPLL